MKLGPWIHLSAAFIASIASAETLNLQMNESDIDQSLRRDSSLTTEQFLEALTKVQSKDEPKFASGQPCTLTGGRIS